MSEQSTSAAMPANSFLRGSISSVFIRTSLPIILVTMVNGMLTVADAMLLGAFVGPEALAAVTLVFPFSMLLVAASTIVGSGMASILGRRLGAGAMDEARGVFASAQGLAIALGIVAIVLFFLGGGAVVAWMAGNNQHLGDLGWQFLAISFGSAPIMFLLTVQSDALRTEGRVAFMAIAGVLLTLGNIALNALLIGYFQFGVAGSAFGTALAQVLALLLIVGYRMAGKAVLPMVGVRIDRSWNEMLALGLPRSLSFIGLSLGSAAVLFSLHQLALGDRETVVTAYGVVMRVMTFAFLPLMGMSLALQAIVGNTIGAGQAQRARDTLRLALGVSVVYGVLVQLTLTLARDGLGGLFVNDPGVAQTVAGIVPIYVAGYFAFGPVMMAASYVQAIGQVRQSAILSLGRTYLFAIPLTLLLPLFWGETGVWIAAPVADMLMLALAILVWRRSR
ncbi:MATE family efflux transporter [Devosia sp.]|uniref:MATE family efflux transporter n=1 Tax=Devosia sp. TaxID=1871048 RepID=UPI001AC3B3DF|nr:MATE family efflux transporter [Devosia sp.]MBN9332900.1 MATE family efflux transporter [Devosia sp.]